MPQTPQTHRFMEVITGLMSIERAISEAINKQLEPTGLNLHEVRLLGLLKAAEKSAMLPKELSDATMVQASVITHRVKGLEERGAVIRKAVESDKRRTMVILTAKGRRAHDLAEIIVRNTATRMRHYFSEEDVEAILRLRAVAPEIYETLG